MKLIRWGTSCLEKPGIFQDGRMLDTSSFAEDYDASFFESGGLRRLASWLKDHGDSLPVLGPKTRLGPPVLHPSKIICIGLNYRDHFREIGASFPAEPVLFLKAPSSLSGAGDPVILPRNSYKTDWEVELALVISHRASYVEEEKAGDYIAGYCLHNDYSEREFQLERGGQWDKGKGCDTFAPLGPWLVTPDEVPDPGQLNLWLDVNGKRMQSANTRNLIFRIPYLIHYVSQFMTLLAGDILSTGTPAGVALGMDPPCYLKEGDRVDSGIDGLGSGHQRIRAWSPGPSLSMENLNPHER